MQVSIHMSDNNVNVHRFHTSSSHKYAVEFMKLNPLKLSG